MLTSHIQSSTNRLTSKSRHSSTSTTKAPPSYKEPRLLPPQTQPQHQLPTISFLRKFFSTTTVNPATMATAKEKAQKIINENAVAVFSKSYCPYCKATKTLLTERGAKYYAIELDQVDDGADIQAALKEINGQTSVPNIYIKQKHIGGNDSLQAIKNDLNNLLTDAGAFSAFDESFDREGRPFRIEMENE
ncbi:hypothetical protein VTL71DRAFT_7895 [Oculimacula yallundae]|uniref:Glutaredoxin domain-containing protein n=1 Tax=Oculimacula yallundae TaxID=86028 RepID=A0ABR4CX06_9HELO